MDGFFDLIGGFPSPASTLLIAVAAILLGWLLYLYIGGRWRYPRGPLRIPAIGHILHVLWHGGIIEFLMQSWIQYGDIFSIQIGSKIFVVLNGYETINDALVKKAKSFSEHNIFFRTQGGAPSDNGGIAFSPYPVWVEHRKLVLNVFRDLGYVKKDLEDKVNQEIVKVIAEISVHARQPFDVAEIMPKATANVISSMVFGSRFEYDDKEFILLLTLLRRGLTEGRRASILQFFPILKYLPMDFIKIDICQARFQLVAFVGKKVADIENNLAIALPSYIKAYLEQMYNDEGLKTGSLTKNRCVSSALDLFGAGSETTATALEWAFLQCILHLDMQQLVHNEIDDVLGQRAASRDDRRNMPFVSAFLAEVLRFGNVSALALPHRVIHDVVLNGKCIPKDTEIIVNLHSILHDERIFDEPTTFQPARFLDRDGKFLQSEKFTPFGMGRRICIGEELAQIELFLFFTATMQRFTLLPAPGTKLSTKAVFGITRRPMPFQVIAVPR